MSQRMSAPLCGRASPPRPPPKNSPKNPWPKMSPKASKMSQTSWNCGPPPPCQAGVAVAVVAARFSGWLRTSKASAASLNLTTASSSPGLRSGWYFSAACGRPPRCGPPWRSIHAQDFVIVAFFRHLAIAGSRGRAAPNLPLPVGQRQGARALPEPVGQRLAETTKEEETVARASARSPRYAVFLSSLFRSVTMVSVVSIKPAMLAAFCKAVRTTFKGSMMPALNMSTYLPLLAS